MADEIGKMQLVIVGSSAGGIEALSTLVATLPSDFPAPLVIAQHLDPGRPSHLSAILARNTGLPVVTVTERDALEQGTIYVVASNRHVQITDSHIAVLPDGPGRPRPSIDWLLSSAAELYGERLIGVILTGMGSDGALGAQRVKEQGGTVIVQDPETAAYPSMPRSLSPLVVDIRAPLEGIGDLLTGLLTGALVLEQFGAGPDESLDGQLQQFLQQVQTFSGVDFKNYKRSTIQRRIQRRLVATGTETLADYVRYVETHPDEYQRLINTFLIKVTEFMRDQELFTVLEHEVLPALVARAQSQGDELRIWSAGCATGEEAYSLAMLVCEVLGDQIDRFSVKIFATDLDPEAVDFARRGIYSAAAVAHLPPHLLHRYFVERQGNYEISKLVRRITVFGEHDLGQRAPFPRIDMVVCRNVLIYFTRDLQERTLKLFAFSLRNDGYLVLGKAETVSPLAEYFTVHNAHVKIYRRRGDRLLIPPPRISDAPHFAAQRLLIQRQRRGLNAELMRIQQELQRTRSTTEHILLQLPVGVVIVDQRYDIHEINTMARQLLAIYSPALGEDFVHLAQSLPSRELRAAIDRAIREETVSQLEEILVEDLTTGNAICLQITCYPHEVREQNLLIRQALILIVDHTQVSQARRHLEETSERQQAEVQELNQTVAQLQQANRELEAANAGLQQRIVELERLAQEAEESVVRQERLMQRVIETNRELVAANSDLTAANQELRSINEELVISAEEAQAATEEMETLNEETQATNEELETLNEELQGTIEELTTTNNDLVATGDMQQERIRQLENRLQAAEREGDQWATLLMSIADGLLIVDSQGETVLRRGNGVELFDGSDGALLDAAGLNIAPAETPRARAARGETFRIVVMLSADNRRRFEVRGLPLAGDGATPSAALMFREIAPPATS